MTSKLKLKECILKLSLSISFFLILIASVILYAVPAAKGYELDIYLIIPNSFFVLIYLSMLIATFICVYVSFNFESDLQLTYCLGILSIILNNFLFANIKLLRGYAFFDRGDMVSHMFKILKISNTTHIDDNNFYPITHILGSFLYEISGFEVTIIDKFIFIPFSILYILSIYILAKKISSSKRFSLMVSLASAIPATGSYGIGLYPAYISILLLPLTLYILFSLNNVKNKISLMICIVIIFLMYPFLHPLTSIILIWLLILIYAIESTYNINIILSLKGYLHGDSKRVTIGLISILLITFTSWISTFSIWSLQIKKVYDIIFAEATSPLSQTVELANKAHFSIFDTLQLTIKFCGGTLFYASIAIVLTFIYLKQNNTQRKNFDIQKNIFVIFGSLILMLLFQLFVILFPTGIDMFRPMRYTFIFSTILLGLTIFINNNITTKKIYICFITFILIFGMTIGLSIRGNYSSPYTFSPNPQVTYQDIAGVKWIEQNRNQTYDIAGIWPFFTYLNILAFLEDNTKLKNQLYKSRISDHFGYDKNNSIGTTYNTDVYVPIFEYDRATELNLWRESGHFYKEDFQKLSQDPSVILIYETGETQIWKI